MCSWEGSATVVGSLFFFFNDTATTEIYTLSLHDALPIWAGAADLDAVEKGLFSERFLLARPVLQALRESPAVLLVDEIDRADDEFEAFLLEVLSTFQVSIPELGTVRAAVPPRSEEHTSELQSRQYLVCR